MSKYDKYGSGVGQRVNRQEAGVLGRPSLDFTALAYPPLRRRSRRSEQGVNYAAVSGPISRFAVVAGTFRLFEVIDFLQYLLRLHWSRTKALFDELVDDSL